MRLIHSVGRLAALSSALFAAHASPITADPPYSSSTSTMAAAVACPDGLTGKQIILAVHGTSSSGYDSWGAGPYRTVLPKLGPGFDLCWVDLPGRSTVDLQLSAEYVAFAIRHLAPSSKSGKVNIISHSQGGPDVTWAMEWFPSTRGLVNVFVANSPDFHGTNKFDSSEASVKQGNAPTSASSLQQADYSNMAKLTKTHVNTAFVPTVALTSTGDEVVGPYPATATLDGIHAVISIQDFCPGYSADHFLMIIAAPAVQLTFQAFVNNGIIDKSQFKRANCQTYPDGSGFNYTALVPYATTTIDYIWSVVTAPNAPGEPLFKQYVCDRNAAPQSSCGAGYFPYSSE